MLSLKANLYKLAFWVVAVKIVDKCLDCPIPVTETVTGDFIKYLIKYSPFLLRIADATWVMDQWFLEAQVDETKDCTQTVPLLILLFCTKSLFKCWQSQACSIGCFHSTHSTLLSCKAFSSQSEQWLFYLSDNPCYRAKRSYSILIHIDNNAHSLINTLTDCLFSLHDPTVLCPISKKIARINPYSKDRPLRFSCLYHMKHTGDKRSLFLLLLINTDWHKKFTLYKCFFYE